MSLLDNGFEDEFYMQQALREARYSRDVVGAGPQIAFLGSAVDKLAADLAFFDIQSADSLGSMEFVGR